MSFTSAVSAQHHDGQQSGPLRIALTVLWPDDFMWMPRQAEDEQMILARFADLGVFLVRGSRHPSEHRSLIAFAA